MYMLIYLKYARAYALLKKAFCYAQKGQTCLKLCGHYGPKPRQNILNMWHSTRRVSIACGIPAWLNLGGVASTRLYTWKAVSISGPKMEHGMWYANFLFIFSGEHLPTTAVVSNWPIRRGNWYRRYLKQLEHQLLRLLTWAVRNAEFVTEQKRKLS